MRIGERPLHENLTKQFYSRLLHVLLLFMKGLCATKDCTLQQWTSWSVISGWSVDACPKERRERVYTSVTRYIDAVNDCQNIGVKSCPPRVKDERAKGTVNEYDDQFKVYD